MESLQEELSAEEIQRMNDEDEAIFLSGGCNSMEMFMSDYEFLH